MEEQTIGFFHQIFEVNSEIGELLSVEYIVYSDFSEVPEAVVLNFENQILTVKAVAEDDTIKLISGKIDLKPEQKLVSASQHKPWCIAIGKSICWSWALINQQGYPDAVQFEFTKDTSIIVQLITAASSIWIYTLDKIAV